MVLVVCENIAKEGVQDTHHWCRRTETATKNGTGQAGSCRHCSSNSSVASWCVFCIPSLAVFRTRCNQI